MTKKNNELTTIGLKEIIIEAIRSKKGESITGLDLAHLNTSICNSFLITDAASTIQVKAIAEFVEDEVRQKCDRKPYHREGLHNGHWVLLDYGDIIVHVFQKPFRDFYDLEELWADGHRTDYQS